MTNVNVDEFIRNAASQEIGFMTRLMQGGYRTGSTSKVPPHVARTFSFHTDKGKLDLHVSVGRMKGFQGMPDRFEFVLAIASDKHGWIAEAKQQLFELTDDVLGVYADMTASAASQMLTSFLQQPGPLPFWDRFEQLLARFWDKPDARYQSTASA